LFLFLNSTFVSLKSLMITFFSFPLCVKYLISFYGVVDLCFAVFALVCASGT
jgi:hypothetical protein